MSQVRVTRPKPTPEGFDFERDSQVEELYFLLLIWMGVKAPSSSHSLWPSVIWGWNCHKFWKSSPISTSVEQTKLPVCAHKADYCNPNTNFRLVIQLKYLVTTYTSFSHHPSLLSRFGVNYCVHRRAANGRAVLPPTPPVVAQSFWRSLLQGFWVLLLNLRINRLQRDHPGSESRTVIIWKMNCILEVWPCWAPFGQQQIQILTAWTRSQPHWLRNYSCKPEV